MIRTVTNDDAASECPVVVTHVENTGTVGISCRARVGTSENRELSRRVDIKVLDLCERAVRNIDSYHFDTTRWNFYFFDFMSLRILRRKSLRRIIAVFRSDGGEYQRVPEKTGPFL